MLGAIVVAITLALPQDDVTVRAELSAGTTAAGSPVSYIVSVTIPGRGAYPTFSIPRMPPGVRILSTYTSEETQIMMPGGRTSVVRREFRLMPTIPDVYTIPATVVTVDGEEYRTQPQQLRVFGSQYQDAAAPVRLRTTVTPPTAYVGQQMVLGMAAIIPLNTRTPMLRGPSFDPPAPEGFWIQDLPDPITIETDMVEGGPAEVQTYQRALFPLTAGTFTIPPGRLVFETRTRFRGGDMQEIRGTPLSVTVMPLPESGRPAKFTGAVGRYVVTGAVDRAEGAAGDAFTYTLMIEGEGNIKGLQPPEFPAIDDVEVYPPSEDASLRVVNARIGGVRTFQWVFIPRRDGTIEIPPISYSWFDPSTGRYEAGATGPVTLAVAAAAPARGSDTALAALRLAMTEPAGAWTASRAFLLLQLVPLLTLLAAVLVRAHRGSAGTAHRAQRAALRRRANALDALAMSDPRAFHAEAIRLLDDVKARAQDTSLIARCDTLAAQLRTTLYAATAPAPAATAKAVKDVQSLVHTALRGRRWPAAVIVLLAVCASGAAYADARTDFANGIAAYQSADYTAASSAFERYTAQQPADASGWYNLGMAAHRADDPGRAIWAWLQAYGQAPRADDIAHNLRVTHASEAAAARAYWVPLSDAELRVALAVCWWLLLLTIALHVLRPARALRIAAVAFLVAGGAAAAPLGARAAAPDMIVPFGRGVTLYAAPTVRTESIGRLEAGGAARVMRREGEWLMVRSPALLEGWVQAADVGVL